MASVPPSNDSYLQLILEGLAPLGEITARRMMGGQTLYCDGVVFALIARGVLHLKANNATRPNFEAHGLSAFRPDEDKPGTMSYYPVPPEVLENREELARWAAEAIAAGRRTSGRKRRRKTSG